MLTCGYKGYICQCGYIDVLYDYKKMKVTISIILILLTQICNAQITPTKKWHITKFIRDTSLQYYLIKIDTINGDTAKYYKKSDRYVELNKEGIILIDGHKLGGMGTVCGCELKPHGYWIERYQNGNLKEQGQYFCNRKIGNWITYFDNGRIKKIENYKRTYLKMFTRLGMPWDTLKTNFLLDGPYLEYYPNGQLKIEGKFEIVEELATMDTIYTFDVETYESIPNIVKGEFWIPRSKRLGIWNVYSEKGELISHDIFEIKTWKDDKIRDIESRYWEIINEIIKFNEEKRNENRTEH